MQKFLVWSLLSIVAQLLSSLPASAAIAECNPEQLQASAPSGMTIKDVPDLVGGMDGAPPAKTVKGVAYVPADAGNVPEYCYVTGTVMTNAATGKVAHFAAAVPSKQAWNGKFMFQGCGGNCGEIYPPSIDALRKGYTVWATDDGHVAKPSPEPRLWPSADASWAVTAPGRRDEDAIADFYHRAVHAVTEAGKKFVRKHYGRQRLAYSYFHGCSDGGREAMVALTHYPQDFDGIIAGAPYFDIANEIVTTVVGVQAQLRSPAAAIGPELFAEADRIIDARCDATDGVQDGLIQNPARCDFNPYRDLPSCGGNNAATDNASNRRCFTPEQIDSLSIITSGITNESGKVVYPGFSVSNVHSDVKVELESNLLAYWLGFPTPPDSLQGPEPWSHDPAGQPLGWYWGNQTMRYFVYDGASDFNALKTPGITFKNSGNGMHAIIPQRTVELFNRMVREGSGATPAAADAFLRQGRKLIMYHGYSDGDITPYRTIQYYRELAQRHGGYEQLRKHAQLYMVPGMGHCMGGPGPTLFGQFFAPHKSDPQHDIINALEEWVERGRQPAQLIATKYDKDDMERRAVVRSMPLCPYPAMARYTGHGDIEDAMNWSCPSSDRRLDEVGSVGTRSGLYAPLPD